MDFAPPPKDYDDRPYPEDPDLRDDFDPEPDEPVFVNGISSDEGTIVVFTTTDHRLLAVDHRIAQGLAELLEDFGEIPVSAEEWQFVGGAA